MSAVEEYAVARQDFVMAAPMASGRFLQAADAAIAELEVEIASLPSWTTVDLLKTELTTMTGKYDALDQQLRDVDEGWAGEQAEAALDAFLGPDGGKTVVELRAVIEHLRALLAATQKALIIEPGKTYVIEIPGYVATEQLDHLRETWQEMTHSKAVIFMEGMRVARVRVESE